MSLQEPLALIVFRSGGGLQCSDFGSLLCGGECAPIGASESRDRGPELLWLDGGHGAAGISDCGDSKPGWPWRQPCLSGSTVPAAEPVGVPPSAASGICVRPRFSRLFVLQRGEIEFDQMSLCFAVFKRVLSGVVSMVCHLQSLLLQNLTTPSKDNLCGNETARFLGIVCGSVDV